MRRSNKKLFRRGVEQKYLRKHTYIRKSVSKAVKVKKVPRRNTKPLIAFPQIMFLLVCVAAISITYVIYQMRLSFSFPDVTLPHITVSIPKISLPKITLPEISIPEVKITPPSLPDIRPALQNLKEFSIQVSFTVGTTIYTLVSDGITFISNVIPYLDPRPLLLLIYNSILFVYPYVINACIWVIRVIDPLPTFHTTLRIEAMGLYYFSILLMEIAISVYYGLVVIFEIMTAVSTAIVDVFSYFMKVVSEGVYRIYVPVSKAFGVLARYTKEGWYSFYTFTMYFVRAFIGSIGPSIELFMNTTRGAVDFVNNL